ncbi:MAG: glycoside hydrolase family 3 C-terminal domain-containing protein [Deltaproteobacteria bacterium]|nr:glycoside hydrolase family 3 C-terminal domain-containing protein [Deltaproteobacteria bacterium]
MIGTYHAYYDDKQAQLVRDLLALNLPTVIVALATPYDLLAFPEAPAYLAAYSNRNLAVTAVAEILFGLRNPAGRLPVDLPGLYPAGWSSAR